MKFTGHTTQMLRAGRPGTMAVVDPRPPSVLHVSTDYGATWQVRGIPPDLRRHSSGALAEQTSPEDWETWPTR